MSKRRLKRSFFVIVSLSSFSYFFFFGLYGHHDQHAISFDWVVNGIKTRSHTAAGLTRFASGQTASPFIEWPPPTCVRKVNIAYIKTHKTASTTLQTVFNRFGLFNNLSFIFNRRSPYNGHFDYLVVDENSTRNYFLPPIGVRTGDYKNYKNYNMIAVHVRYYRKALDLFMANGTRYVTIIREPSDQWESAFNHFDFKRAMFKEKGESGLISANNTQLVSFDDLSSSEDFIHEFMRKPETYHRILKTAKYKGRADVWHYARNNQLFDLGLEPQFHGNETLVNETVQKLGKEFSLVIITEFFDESLVVLKKMLCWTWEDILYVPKNQRMHRSKLSDDTREKIRQWNHADVLLYDYFNKTLWKRIRGYGPLFSSDLATFRRLLNETRTNCTVTSRVQGKIFQHVEFIPKVKSSPFCQTVAEGKRELFNRVFRRQGPKRTPKRTSLKKHLAPLPKKPVWPFQILRENQN